MDKTENKQDGLVVDFSAEREKQDHITAGVDVEFEAKSTEDYLALGVQEFGNQIAEAEAFLAITFDIDGTPQIIWAGDLDPFRALGAMEISKRIFEDKMC